MGLGPNLKHLCQTAGQHIHPANPPAGRQAAARQRKEAFTSIPLSLPHVSNILGGTERHVSLFLHSYALPLLLLFLIISKTNMCERGGRRRAETQDHAVCGLLISIMWEKLQTGRFTCPKHRRPPRFASVLPSLLMNEKPYERAHSSVLICRNTPSFFIQTLNLLHSVT